MNNKSYKNKPTGILTLMLQTAMLICLTAITASAFPGDLDLTFNSTGIAQTSFGYGKDNAQATAIQTDGKIIVAGYVENSANDDFALVRYNTDGTLDTTFGTGGKVITPVGNNYDSANAIALQPNGKIVLAGESFSGSSYDFALVRYNTDGTLDTSFGTGGKVITPVGIRDDFAYAVAVQTDGKIVAAGRSDGDDQDFALVRYNTDGTLDTTFGTNGKVITAVGTNSDYINDIAVQSDGKIVAVGYAQNGTTVQFGTVRYNTNGTLDTTFGTGGKVITPVGLYNDRAKTVAIQSDGKIITAGSIFDNTNTDFGVVRYNTDGTLDTTFGTGGKVITRVGASSGYANAVAVQTDGKIILAGSSLRLSYCFAVVRYNTDGTLDTSFGTDGKVISVCEEGSSDFATAVAVQANGKIIATGSFTDGRSLNFKVVRYNTDGTSDTAFGTDGAVITDVGNAPSFTSSTAIQTDGKIIAAGNTYNGANDDFALVRYNTDGTLDTTFGTGGKVITPVGTHYDFAYAVAVQTDGKIIVAGSSSNGTFTDFALVRYNTDGTLDTTFGTGGKVITSIGIRNDFAYEVAVQADGKIVAAGSTVAADGTRENFALVRYNTDGTLDTTFGTGGKVVTVVGKGYEYITDIAIQTDGKIVATGSSYRVDNDFTLVRYNTDGTLDSTFGTEGKVFTSIVTGGDFSNAVAIQADGKIVAGGAVSYNTYSKFALVRYNTDGTLDTTFGTDGKVITSVLTSEIITDIVIQTDGKIVAAGSRAVAGYNTNGTLDTNFGTGGIKIIKVLEEFRCSESAIDNLGRIVLVGNLNRLMTVVRLQGKNNQTAKNGFDFDGDGKADISVFRPSTGFWYRLNSSNGEFTATKFGLSEDLITPADFDGDGKTDIAVFRPSNGYWYRLNSSDGSFSATQFGANGDLPASADYDGDGKADITVYRPSTGTWYRLNSLNGQIFALRFGISEDKPAVGDFDGDGRADISLYRVSTKTFYRLNSSNGAFSANSGIAGEGKVVTGDYDGDGKTDIAVWQAGNWSRQNSSNGQYVTQRFGADEDKPVAADYDGDGKTDIAVYRPSTGIWHLMRSSQGFTAVKFGVNEDIPVANAYVR